MEIEVGLTTKDFNRFKKEAKAYGMTRSTLLKHKLIANKGNQLVIESDYRPQRTYYFSVSPYLKGHIEQMAFENNTSMSGLLRELIINH